MVRNPEFLGTLVSKGIVSQDAVVRLREKHQEDAFSILLHLIAKGAHNKDVLGMLWGDSINVAYVNLGSMLMQPSLVQQIPEYYARKNHVVPLYKFGEATTVALANPQDQIVTRDLETYLRTPVSPVFTFPHDIEEALEGAYISEDNLKALSNKITMSAMPALDITELTKEQLLQAAGDQAVVEFVNGLIRLAVREHASDIHIEPGFDQVRIRFRIDGLLHERSKIENSLLPPVISVLKLMASMDITEKRRPRDGRISIDFSNRMVDFRISTIPTIYGEKIVLRVLGQAQMADVLDISELLFSRSYLDMVREALNRPHGIFFITGPTGSGKTTTLFSMLKHLNKPTVNITTVEEPVEYRLDGINQLQVNPAVGVDFASAIKAFLRQDPDIILVGEIRDMETAQTACRAALTGHLVLGTMHTNTAVQAITRLTDIGVDPLIVAPSIVGVLSQRLVRRICDYCKEEYPAPSDFLRKTFTRIGKDVFFYRGKGCFHCKNSGYSGRIGIHEMILVDKEIRIMIARGASVSEIQEYARRLGFRSLRFDGIKKVLRGLTTVEEVLRVAAVDDETFHGSF
jgi:type IV pilus assembly protein PilB